MGREEMNDITAAMGDDPESIEVVLDEAQFQKWLDDKLPKECAEKCVRLRQALVNFKPPPAMKCESIDSLAMFSFDYDDEDRPWDQRSADKIALSDQYDSMVHTPGTANCQIAEVALGLPAGVEVYGQQETVDAYNARVKSTGRPLVPYHRTSIPRYVEPSERGVRAAYLGTKSVACDLAWRGLWQKQCIAVIAHGDHVRRCCGAVRRAVIDERLRRSWQCDGNLLPTIVVPDLSVVQYPSAGWQVWVSGAGKPGRGGPKDFRRHDVTGRIKALLDGWLTWEDLI